MLTGDKTCSVELVGYCLVCSQMEEMLLGCLDGHQVAAHCRAYPVQAFGYYHTVVLCPVCWSCLFGSETMTFVRSHKNTQ